MRTIIIKKNQKYILFAIIHFLLFVLIKNVILRILIEENNFTVGNEFGFITSYEGYFGSLYAISSLFIANLLYTDIKTNNENKRISIGLLIGLFWYVFYAFGQNSSIELHPDTRGYSSFEFYSYYVIFIPYLYLIYTHSIVGIKEDITIEVKNKKDEKHIDSLEDLDKLLKLNLLTNQEHQQKKELQKKNKIREDIKETEEYNLLIKSKAIGLINEDEFNMKIKGLIDKIYKENEK